MANDPLWFTSEETWLKDPLWFTYEETWLKDPLWFTYEETWLKDPLWFTYEETWLMTHCGLRFFPTPRMTLFMFTMGCITVSRGIYP